MLALTTLPGSDIVYGVTEPVDENGTSPDLGVIEQAELLVATEFGHRFILPRSMSRFVVAFRDQQVIGASYITILNRVDSLVVAPEARGSGVHIEGGIAAIDQFVRESMTIPGQLSQVSYFSFIADPNAIDRMISLGFEHKPYFVFEKTLLLDGTINHTKEEM